MADITFHGNATGEPELKYTPSGTAVLNVDVAENHRKKDQQGKWQKDGTTFYRVTMWGHLAETMAGQIFTGTRLLITGRFRGGEFTSRDGQQVRTYEVTANQCGVIPRSDQGSARPAQNQSMPPTTGGWGHQQTTGSSEWGGGNSDTAPF
jgi:single-strand DNA-binding protein